MFCWFEPICGEDGKMCMVKCRICSKVKGKDKLLVPKLNSLIKHSGMQKCTIARLGVVIRQYCICPTNSHVKNEKLFATRGLDTVGVQLENGVKAERKKKPSNLWQFGIFLNKAVP
jgi:hypothetical protein